MYFCKLFQTVKKQGTILESLDRFIRKYYKNRMIKGVIYSLALLLSLFLLITLLEYFGYFGSVVRAILFWLYLVIALFVLGYYIAVPLAKMYRIGKVISYEEAAVIVGNHFPEIKDSLLNLLQLQEQKSDRDDELLRMAIEQKTAQLKPLPFHQAVNIKANLRYVKFAAIPVLAILVLLLVSPTLLTAPSHRIVHYNTQFEKPAPFAFVVENNQMEVFQYEDFEIEVSVVGDAVPAEAFIDIGGNVFKMQQVDKSHYRYVARTVQHTFSFRLKAADVESKEYTLTVLPKPAVIDFQACLSYPSYTGKAEETLFNVGDVVVPEGTSVKWIFNTRNVDTLFFYTETGGRSLVPDGNGRVSLTVRAMNPFDYSFFVSNRKSSRCDTLNYSVSTIADNPPMISVFEMRDSLLSGHRFFKGKIKDDYGFSRLVFKTIKTNVEDTTLKTADTTEIGITRESVQEFNYSTDLDDIDLSPGDKLVYYFEVWDNDGVHGPKSSTSQQFEIVIPTAKEMDKLLERNSNEAQKYAQKSMSELKKMQEDINELMRKLVDKKELNWQDKKDLQELSKKQEEVKKMLQQLQNQLNENKQIEQKYKEQSEELMKKQQELDRLMNEVLNEEMKEMMREIDQMMKEMDKKNVQEQLEKLKMDNSELEKQIDQNLELFKRLEIEKKVEDAVHKAESLAEKQRELSKKTEDSKANKDNESLLKEQKNLSEQFEQLKQDIRQIQSDYKKLDQNLDFKVNQEQLNKIDNNQQGAENDLKKGKNKSASQKQKDAAQQLDELSEQLAEAEQDIEQEDLAEDAEAVRRLLKNLIQVSFNQESLIGDIHSIYIQDPKYQSIIASQYKIKDDFKGIEDSLRAIAKRQIAVASAINKNVNEVNNNISRSLSGLLDMNQTFYGTYKNTQASQSMQYAMTSLNNLALVMAESLDNMKNQMRQNDQQKKNGSCKNQGKKSQGSCSNPGKGKPSPKSMKQMQQELNKQMEALKKQLEKQGNKSSQGRKKIGEKSSMQMSEEFARMAAQQELIRRMMQEYGQEMKQSDAGNSKLSKEIDQMIKQMEQTETDLVNKVITQQTIKRQQQILTRLLEHEKAEMQREKEERRESREGKEKLHTPSQSEIEKYERSKKGDMDLFHSVPPTLSPYYKTKVNDYFYKY